MVALRDLPKWLRAEFRWRVLGKRYEIKLSASARRQLDEMDEERRAEVMKRIDDLSKNPYSGRRMDEVRR